MKVFKGNIPLAVVLVFITRSVATFDLSDIEARFGVLNNGEQPSSVSSNVTLTNTGAIDIDTGDVPITLYVCFIRLVLESNTESGVQVSTEPNITVYHLDGCAHKIVYDAPFKLSAGSSLSIKLIHQFWTVAYTDIMPNWYIQLGDGSHQLINNTKQDQTQFVDPFDTKEKYLRSSADLVFPLTLEQRYNDQKKLTTADDIQIKQRLVPDIFTSLRIDSQTKFTPIDPSSAQIPVIYKVSTDLKEDQITLQISEIGNVVAEIPSNTSRSRNLALSTVTQLLERFDNQLPVGTYKTVAPRFNFRGHMLDIARQFHNKDVIKRQLDLMWRYKLNILHLHLIDDESWRLEIEGIPELTKHGSKQCFNLSECATYPQLGGEINADQEYLTKEDYIEIVSYAENLGIRVLPEVELPGHSTAAVQAMDIRYSQSPDATDYRLRDPNDKSVYQSVQYFTMGAMNPCVPSMYRFVEDVVSTIQRYHEEAGQPLEIIHLAGDEVANTAWVDSPACETLFSSSAVNTTTAEEKQNVIKITMTEQLGIIAERLNVSLAFWEDGLINKTSKKPFVKDIVFPPSVDVYSFIWQTVWEWWGGDRAFNMANGGYKVVMSPATRYYLDHPQEPHPNEHGYYWAARSTNFRRAFSFRPINYYANIDGIQRFGLPITEKSWCTSLTKCPPLVSQENIVGVEAPLFGETIRNQDHIDNNVWPRMLAISERGWRERAWEALDGENPSGLQQDFDMFRQVVEEYELPNMEQKHNVKYHLSPPGAMVLSETGSSIVFKLSVEFKGQRVWWRDSNSKRLTEAVNLELEYTKGSSIHLSTSNAAGTRYSYEVMFYKDREPTNRSTIATLSSMAMTAVCLCIFTIATHCYF